MPLLFYSFPCFFCLPPSPFLLLLVLRPLPRPVSLCLLSTLVVPSILPMQLDFSPPALSRVPARARDKKKAIQVAGIGAFAPGRASNLIIRRLIIREKGTRITRVQLFSPESFRSPFIGDLMRRSIACRARICADLTRAHGDNVALSVSLSLSSLYSVSFYDVYLSRYRGGGGGGDTIEFGIELNLDSRVCVR